MPELPEVETMKRYLHRAVKGKTIASVQIRKERIIRTPDCANFQKALAQNTIQSVERKGKHLLFVLQQGVLVSHLRMEGKYQFLEKTTAFHPHDHVIFTFTDNSELRYNDVRQFGTMDYVSSPTEVASIASLGLEPDDPFLTPQYLHTQFERKKTTIKQALLAQTIVAGLGNIYVDEVCFVAKIHPTRFAHSLSLIECAALVEAISSIIKQAISHGGSSIRTYHALGSKGSMQDFHQVYNKKGKPCTRCNTPIEKIKHHGRGTHFCPICQLAAFSL